jgi:hypothetical protein
VPIPVNRFPRVVERSGRGRDTPGGVPSRKDLADDHGTGGVSNFYFPSILSKERETDLSLDEAIS